MTNEKFWNGLAVAVVAGVIGFIFGIPILEDLFPFGLLVAVAIGLGYFVEWRWKPRFGSSRHSFDDALSRVMVVVLAWLLLSQLAGTAIMFGLKSEFRAVAAKGNTGTTYQGRSWDDDRPIYGWDFGGKLDRLVAQRKARLRKLGFIGLGAWEATSGGTHTTMAYIWVGPLRYLF